MPINVTSIDNKFKRKKQKNVKQQREYDSMVSRPSELAMERFKAEPYQLRYAREYGQSRTK